MKNNINIFLNDEYYLIKNFLIKNVFINIICISNN